MSISKFRRNMIDATEDHFVQTEAGQRDALSAQIKGQEASTLTGFKYRIR